MGKSLLSNALQTNKPKLGDLDRHLPNGGGGLRYGFRHPCSTPTELNFLALCNLYKVEQFSGASQVLASVFREKMKLEQFGPWLEYNESGEWLSDDWASVFEKIPPDSIRMLWTQLTGSSGGSREQHWIPQSVAQLRRPLPSFSCHLIPAIRKVGEKDTVSTDFSGLGIIERLAKLQNPSALEQQDKQRFQRIGDFLRTVTDNPTAEIEIPYDRSTILIRMDGKTLPLESLGSGIHEVIILAAAATVLEGAVVCMEEPELHL